MPSTRKQPDFLRGLEIHQFPGVEKRDPRLPTIYKYIGDKSASSDVPHWAVGTHPQRLVRHPYTGDTMPECYRPTGITYVVFVDSSAEGKRTETELGRNLRIPSGREETISASHGV